MDRKTKGEDLRGGLANGGAREEIESNDANVQVGVDLARLDDSFLHTTMTNVDILSARRYWSKERARVTHRETVRLAMMIVLA